MNINWSSSFPESFLVNGCLLSRLPNIKNFERFVFLANKYRNIFRNNFLNNAQIPLEDSKIFFSNLDKDNSRILYGISYNEEWIGHFGLKLLGNKDIMLDNAIRFSAKGGKKLFRDINLELIKQVKINLVDYDIFIIIKKGNTTALNLHIGLGFTDCNKDYYDMYSIDAKGYSLMKINRVSVI
jgi:hypothetical protein